MAKKESGRFSPAANSNTPHSQKGRWYRPGGTWLRGAGGLRFPTPCTSRAIEATIELCPAMMSPEGPECGGNVKLPYPKGNLVFPRLALNLIDSNGLLLGSEKPACQSSGLGPFSAM